LKVEIVGNKYEQQNPAIHKLNYIKKNHIDYRSKTARKTNILFTSDINTDDRPLRRTLRLQ